MALRPPSALCVGHHVLCTFFSSSFFFFIIIFLSFFLFFFFLFFFVSLTAKLFPVLFLFHLEGGAVFSRKAVAPVRFTVLSLNTSGGRVPRRLLPDCLSSVWCDVEGAVPSV